MDKGRSQRLKIARQVAAWGTEIPALRVRIAGAVAKPSVPGRQKIELEVMGATYYHAGQCDW
jgi:hypothetical protein